VTSSAAKKKSFAAINEAHTAEVVARLARAGRHGAVVAEAPPGAGKSTLTVSVAKALVDQDRKLRLAIVTQTNEQADDLVSTIAKRYRELAVARMHGGNGPSLAIQSLLGPYVHAGDRSDDAAVSGARVVIATARKWQYERSRLQTSRVRSPHPIALIDEAYQMRSDMLLGIADLFETLFCVGDPGQLDPFTVVDDSPWKGLAYSPSRAAMTTLRQFRQDLTPIQLPISWRLPPSAAGIVSNAFYPFSEFAAGTEPGDRRLELGRQSRSRPSSSVDADTVLDQAMHTGWGYVELPERFTPRTDTEAARTLAGLVQRLLGRGGTVYDELNKKGKQLLPGRVAVVAAHNDQVHAVRYELSNCGVEPDSLTVSTANKIQGREYDVVFVWHPLAGRRDATAFHLESGRMCVMLSRHRQACVVVGRAGAQRLLEEFPDSDPLFLDEPEKFPDGWQANHAVLGHLEKYRVA
jgi:hypothetical protein